MEGKDFCCYEFEEFRLDARRRSLSKNGEKVPLSARNFDLLLFMVENGGRILEHDELLDKVWAGTFVEQATLKKGISALRHILEEKPETEFIKTIPRRGYSFVSPVRITPEDNEVYFVRETEREIIVEEYEETGNDSVKSAIEVQKILPAPQNQGLFAKIKKYKIPVVIVSILFSGLIGYGIWTLTSKTSSRFSFENIKITSLTKKGNLNGAVVSPKGNYFIYASLENDGSSLWVQQIATGGATRLTPKMKASFWFYTFSPDENYVYYTINNHSDLAQNGSFKIPLFGASPQRISENSYGIIFSPDGSRIAFIGINQEAGQIFTANPDFSDKKPITSFGEEFRVWSMKWSPDGQALLFALRKFAADKTIHYVVEFPTGGGREKIIVPEMEKQITGAEWLPDKSSLLVCLREVNAEIRQIWQYFPSSGEFRRVTNDNNSYKGFSLTNDGKTIVTITENSYASIWTAEDEKYNFKQITSGANDLDVIGWTADGRLIYSSTENSVEAVSVINADGSQSSPITAGNDGIRLYPRVSGDGKSVLIASTRAGLRQFWRVDFEGRNFTQMPQTGDIRIFDGKLLSDNQTLIFQGEGKGKFGILYKQTSDGTITPLTEESVDAWDISPDEKFLAYASVDKETRKKLVFVKYLESGWLFKTFDLQPNLLLRWTRDGKALTYEAVNDDSSAIFLQPIEGVEPKLLAKFPAEQVFSFDWSFDGKKLAVIRGKQLNNAVLIKIEDKSN